MSEGCPPTQKDRFGTSSPTNRLVVSPHAAPVADRSRSASRNVPVRRSSRLNNVVFTFQSPTPDLTDIEDGAVAGDELLLKLGFALCDNDTLW
jgi:hypothetical protein